jgi:hypothetical protein
MEPTFFMGKSLFENICPDHVFRFSFLLRYALTINGAGKVPPLSKRTLKFTEKHIAVLAIGIGVLGWIPAIAPGVFLAIHTAFGVMLPLLSAALLSVMGSAVSILAVSVWMIRYRAEKPVSTGLVAVALAVNSMLVVRVMAIAHSFSI